jgi:hypothetical protein
MKTRVSLLLAVALFAVMAGGASAREGWSTMSECSSDTTTPDYVTITTYGTPALKSFNVDNPCDSWTTAFFGDAQGNALAVFYIPPGTSTTVKYQTLRDNGLDDLEWTSGGTAGGALPCPTPFPDAPASFLVEPDGSLQPFVCSS